VAHVTRHNLRCLFLNPCPPSSAERTPRDYAPRDKTCRRACPVGPKDRTGVPASLSSASDFLPHHSTIPIFLPLLLNSGSLLLNSQSPPAIASRSGEAGGRNPQSQIRNSYLLGPTTDLSGIILALKPKSGMLPIYKVGQVVLN